MGARVIVTGARGGIGSVTTELLRGRGARVVGLDLEADDGADILACDVRDQVAVDDAVAHAVERLGGLDVLINCAGIGVPQSAIAAPTDADLDVLSINLVGPWRVTAAAIGPLRASRGRVINVASGLAYLTVPFSTAYCMSKRGLTAFSDALRLEIGDEVSVTTVYPGYIRTPIHDEPTRAGLSVEGALPVEQVMDAAQTLVSASLDPNPPRDVATTRSGALSYAALRHFPRGLVDRLTSLRIKSLARSGHFDSSEIAADYVARARRAT